MKAAVIGVGRMGRRHIEVIKKLELELVGVADESTQSLETAAEEQNLSQEQLFSSAEKLLEERKPECVVIATTAPSHAEYVVRAAQAGARYILCEKPMGTSLAECDTIIGACGEHNVKLAVNHQMRFMEQYTKTKEIVSSEEFGGLSSITMSAGNFGVAMNGSHYFEMFRYMTDENPQNVSAWFSEETVPNPRGAQYEDRAGSIRATTASGKRFYLDVSADQGHGIKVIYSGPSGQLVVDELAGIMYLSVREESYRDLPTTRYGMPAIEKTIRIAPADSVQPSLAVLKALLDGQSYPDEHIGRMIVSCLVAAYVSNESGHAAVGIDDRLPKDRVFPWA